MPDVELVHGDCLDKMKLIPNDIIDMVLTSPPYDNLRSYNESLNWGEHIWKPVIEQLFRIIKVGGVVVWIVGDATIKGSETGTSFKQALYFKEIGFNLHDTMIWYKTAIFPHHLNARRYKQQFEYMFVFTKGLIKTYNPIHDIQNESAGKTLNIKKKIKTSDNGKYNGKTKTLQISDFRMRDNVWREGRAGYKGHPAPFPEKLAYDHISSWSNEGDMILDPFAGSGTTGKMAKHLKRNCILIEKELGYIDIIRKRLNEQRI
jgi:site-specific DNA-methyltransferase (adenine-specific)